MKLYVAALAVCTLALPAQEYPAGQPKHLTVPTATSVRPVSVSALSIERGAEYPSIIHLKGSVEIKTPVCIRQASGQVCAGSVVLRADEADFHEDSGQIDAHGNVTVTRDLINP